MTLEIRPPRGDEELRAGMIAAETAFGEELTDEDWARESKSMPAERALVAIDAGRPVALAGAYAFELTIPGGQLPAAGVTWIGVSSSHRRRGILREFMTRQFADFREWGEAVAVLYASEASIYGRFGYGTAAPSAAMDADRAAFALRDDPGPQGSWRLIDRDEAYERFPAVYERVRAARPGMLTRNEHWWREHRLADPKEWRQGAGPKLYALLELDGEAAAFAMYRVKHEWDDSGGEVRVTEAFADGVAATREVWRYLFCIDLTARVKYWLCDPAAPYFLMVRDPRSLKLRVGDGLWLRFVDVETALRARSYAGDGSVVLEVHDELCPWNAGRYRVGATVERTDDAADLELDVADLASAYLGAFDFHRLAYAGRVRELRAGALERASGLFRTPLPPWCPEVF
jgi:predicted acetyltransferase